MNLRAFFGIVRELSFDELRAEALTSPRLLVIARNEETALAWRKTLFGEHADEFVDALPHNGQAVDPLNYDSIVSIGPLDPATARLWRDRHRRLDEPMRVTEVDPSSPVDDEHVDAIRRRLAGNADDRALAIGRYIEAMRSACAAQIVADTALANAQFALISNIPTVVPVVGSVLAVGADFLVLTKNQLMMIYKLAAVFQRSLDNRFSIYAEMIPVVGAGLAWRTAARELSSLLPFAIGTVPKVAIAYAGTFATGRAAHLYYERGRKLDRHQMRGLYAEALERLEHNPLPLPSRFRRGRDSSPDGKDREREPQA